MVGTRHGDVFRQELSPGILELCNRAATKVVWVTVSQHCEPPSSQKDFSVNLDLSMIHSAW